MNDLSFDIDLSRKRNEDRGLYYVCVIWSYGVFDSLWNRSYLFL